MRVYNALVALTPGDGNLFRCDAIEREGHFWLVPIWLYAQDGSGRTPSYMIQIDSLPHQRMESGEIDFVINEPIPKPVFEGQQTAPGFVVKILPDISAPTHGKHH